LGASMRLHLAAITVGELTAPQLWTLLRLADSEHRLTVVNARRGSAVSGRKRLARRLRDVGPLQLASRLLGRVLIGDRHERRARDLYERLFDGASLRERWAALDAPVRRVATLNGKQARRALTESAPDVAVRVSGGILQERIFSIPRLATLNLHHGLAPAIRGMWSIPWGVVEQRADWIGATVHAVDAGIDTGKAYRRVAPQLAPGDTIDTLFFRTHLLVVEALAQVIDDFASGRDPEVLDQAGPSTYRSAPGVRPWLTLLRSGAGRRASITLDEALR